MLAPQENSADNITDRTKIQDEYTPKWLLREIMRLLNPTFPPAALALHELALNRDVTDADCACLAQCLWGLAREIVPRATVPDKQVRPMLPRCTASYRMLRRLG